VIQNMDLIISSGACINEIHPSTGHTPGHRACAQGALLK